MSLYIDRKYVSLLSPRLEKFHQKSEYLWNFRCPICGDSSRNRLKMRGYLYRRKSDLFFTCHNCGTNSSFGNFLKTVDRPLYSAYQMERFKEESGGNVAKPDFSEAKGLPVFEKKVEIKLPSVESLDDKHSAKHYVKDRKIPKDKWNAIYYANDFEEFVKEILPEYDKTLYNEPRLILPFYDEKNILLGFQGRALVKSSVKYITIKLSDDNKKVYGLNTIDKSKKTYVVEGPIDSLFLTNAIAMMDASLYNAVATVGDLNYTFIYDNEPRTKDIVKHMQKTIDLGKDICIWPKLVEDCKDINEMVTRMFSPSAIQAIIDNNTYSGIRAKLEFEKWRKI